jgi:hypothetical protein
MKTTYACYMFCLPNSATHTQASAPGLVLLQVCNAIQMKFKSREKENSDATENSRCKKAKKF